MDLPSFYANGKRHSPLAFLQKSIDNYIASLL